MPKSHPKCHFCGENRWPISKTWSRQHGEPVCTRCGEESRRQYVLGRPAPEVRGRLPSAIRPNPASLGGDSFRVVAHGKNGEVAYRGAQHHRTYAAAWREAQVIAKRRDLTDVHVVKNGENIIGEIKARKNPYGVGETWYVAFKEGSDRPVGIYTSVVSAMRILKENEQDPHADPIRMEKMTTAQVEALGLLKKRRSNPTKTFFCFPCGRRFISTGSASQANCPDCRRVCQATRMKTRSNPRRRARRGR